MTASSVVVEWPSIAGLHNVLSRVAKKDVEISKLLEPSRGRFSYRGKIKLHGANHGITVHRDGTVVLQSRNSVLKESPANSKSFSGWASSRVDFFRSLFGRSVRLVPSSSSRLTVFGEWCGPGVQKGSDVAIGKIPSCVFAVFGIGFGVSSGDRAMSILVDPDRIRALLACSSAALPDGLHVIPWLPGAAVELDLTDARSLAEKAGSIDELVARIDREDPWVLEVFGVRGPGEGIVWYPAAGANGLIDAGAFEALSFKTKGESHQMIQARQTMATATEAVARACSVITAPLVAQSAEDFAFMFLTRARLLQGLSEVCPEAVERTDRAAFVEWIAKDVKKESTAELEASALEWAAVVPLVRERAGKWFDEQLSSAPAPPASEVARSASAGLFAGLSFCFSESVVFRTKGELTKKIKDAGGSVQFSVSRGLTHLVASDGDCEVGRLSTRVAQAASRQIPVVSEAYVSECLEQSRLLNEVKYNPLAAKAREQAAAQQGQEQARKRVVERPTVWTFGGGNEPKFSDDYDIVRKVVLQATDIQSRNTNKFYTAELHSSNEVGAAGFVYRVWTQHGRTDELSEKKRGQCETRYLSALADAEEIFDDIIAGKLEDGGYSMVDLVAASPLIGSRPSSDPAPAATGAHSSKLSPPVESVVRFVFERASAAVAKGVAARVTPRGIESALGVLSLQQIARAEQVLVEIEEALGPSQDDTVIEKLTGEFFSVVPQSIGKQRAKAKGSVIDTQEKVDEKLELLSLMKDLVKVTSQRKQEPSGSEVDNMADALGCTIVAVDPGSIQFRQLAARFVSGWLHGETAQSKPVTTSGIEVLNIFKIKRKEEQGPFARASSAGNLKLLWHASKVENFLGLLSRGILTPTALKLASRRKGGEIAKRTDFGFLGAGLYFSDSSLASMKYAGAATESAKQRLLILGVSVVCGNVANFTKVQPFLTSPPAGFHSVHGVGRHADPSSDFENDEYVVFDPASQKLEFLVEFKLL